MTQSMTTNIKRCYQCNTRFEPWQPIYRAGDTDQCSEECRLLRSNFIEAIDPELKSPGFWRDIEYYDNNSTIEVNKQVFPFNKSKTHIWIDVDNLLKSNLYTKKNNYYCIIIKYFTPLFIITIIICIIFNCIIFV